MVISTSYSIRIKDNLKWSGCKIHRSLKLFEWNSFHKSPRRFHFTNALEIAILAIGKNMYQNLIIYQHFICRFRVSSTLVPHGDIYTVMENECVV